MLGNGVCDFGCNTALCGFDLGDCAVSNDTFDRYQREAAKSEDTYRDSLISTTLELIRMFGGCSRDIPAHMPHLMNRRVWELIERNMTAKFNETIHHRFRESSDLQYAFLYFHYLESLGPAKAENRVQSLWRRGDTDLNGVLSQNELETLNALCFESNANGECVSRAFRDA